MTGAYHKLRNTKRVGTREHLVIIGIGTSASHFQSRLADVMRDVPQGTKVSGIEREDDSIAIIFDEEVELPEV